MSVGGGSKVLKYTDIFFQADFIHLFNFVCFCLVLEHSPFFHYLLVPSLLKSVLKIQVAPPLDY